MGTIDLGDTVALSWPLGKTATILVTVTLPDGTTSTPAVTGTSTYAASFVASQAGRHVVAWTASTSDALADEFEVAPAPGIVSLADVKEYLGAAGSNANDDRLRMIALAASEVVEQYTGRTYRRATKTEVHDGGKSAVNLRSTPVISIVSVTDSGGALPSGGYTIDLNSGVLHRGPQLAPINFIWGRQNVTVVYVAGATVVPARIRVGTLEVVRHLWSTQRGGAARPQVTGNPADQVYTASGWARVRELLDSDKAPGF